MCTTNQLDATTIGSQNNLTENIMSSGDDHLHLEPEYKPRAHYGVVSCLRRLENGEVRLILDDVCSPTDEWPQVWQSHWLFTQRDYAGEEFLACELSEEQTGAYWTHPRCTSFGPNHK